ncbi:MAG: nucleotidyltransferase family protein [Reyranella sp.]|uniref:nucleotidyltransferase family protein n=1 Tax=Reyranella sp. TaxID=1929291 RepID=UPI003D0EE63F
MKFIAMPTDPLAQAARLNAVIQDSPLLSAVTARWAHVGLPDAWLTAGAIAQTVWNDGFGLPPEHGIADVDIVYFDGEDLSAEAEATHAARVRRLFSDLAVWIDVKNEARVHLWYEAKFGRPLTPYVSTADAISTFPTTATAVGVQPRADGLALVAPFGLADLLGLVVRPNKKQISSQVYEAKIGRWLTLWPGLQVVPWDEVPVPHGAAGAC